MPPAASGSAGSGSAGSGSAGSGFAGTGGACRAGGPDAAGNRLRRRPPPCAGAADGHAPLCRDRQSARVVVRIMRGRRTVARARGRARGRRQPHPNPRPAAGRSLPAATRGQHGRRPRRQRPRGAYRPPVALRTSRRPAQPRVYRNSRSSDFRDCDAERSPSSANTNEARAEGLGFGPAANSPADRRLSRPRRPWPRVSPDSVRHDAKGPAGCTDEKGLQMQAFRKAADGIRTHDLLHGKQKVGEGSSHKLPANALLHAGVRHAGCLGFHADCRTFED